MTHAALPVAEARDDGMWNPYLSLRDGEGRARIGRTRLRLEPSPHLAPLEREPLSSNAPSTPMSSTDNGNGYGRTGVGLAVWEPR